MNAWAQLSDEALLAQRARTADACVRVMEMPLEERQAVRGHLGASAEQAGALAAMLTIMADAEVKRRGLE